MPKQKQIHVTFDKSDDTWDVKSAGSSKAYRSTDRKTDAVTIATQVAKNQGAELFIHGKDNEIQSRNSYGNDPFPPKG